MKIYACWVYVSDLQKSIDFYTAIGFTVKFIDNDWVEFNLGETSFAILQRPADKGKVTPEKTRIMFMVDDIESMYETLKQQNVTLIGNIRDESYGKLLTFADPDGHWLEFFQIKK
ncbi:MAG: VOC family protein [Gammaproteobacteria bacterium]|nr:VOC family protein [Gammaproteobacteria bacterium]